MSHLEVYALATSAMYNAGGEVAGIGAGVIPTKPKTLHLFPSRRTLDAGEPFIVDLGGVYKRYHANIARCYYWGDPTPELRRSERRRQRCSHRNLRREWPRAAAIGDRVPSIGSETPYGATG